MVGNKRCVSQKIFQVPLELLPARFFRNLRLTYLIVCVYWMNFFQDVLAHFLEHF